jgi:threonine dehydrogenase-like Zn-dependent dehydrogenase
MRALVWHGKEDIRCDRVSDPEIEDPRDAIIKVTSCAICGSDLHLFHNMTPAMMPGDIMGHETMGEVVETGSGLNGSLKKGDRVVIPFTISCGQCEQCLRGNFSVCETTNRKKELAEKAFGHATGGLFGYTHLTGGYPGGQAEYLRVPYADSTHIKVPDSMSDEQALFLSDILPTGWQAAVQCESGRLGLRAGRSDGDPQRGFTGSGPRCCDRLSARAAVNGGSRRGSYHQLQGRERLRAAERADQGQGA